MTAVFSQTIGHFAVPHVYTLLCVVLLSLRAHMAPYSTVTPSPSKYSAWQAAKKMLRCDRQQLGGASLQNKQVASPTSGLSRKEYLERDCEQESPSSKKSSPLKMRCS